MMQFRIFVGTRFDVIYKIPAKFDRHPAYHGKPSVFSLFSPGEVGDCSNHWQVNPADKEPGQGF